MRADVGAAIKRIAKENRVSEQEVIEEMQKAIDAGYNSPDPEVQAKWAAMPFKNAPTPEELIAYLLEHYMES